MNLLEYQSLLCLVVLLAKENILPLAAVSAIHCHMNVVAVRGANISLWDPIALASASFAFSL